LKEKLVVHFSKRTQTMISRVQKIKSMNKQITQSTLSMKAKIKSKPISLLNANENGISNQEANEKNQVLNFQPITGAQLIKHTRNLKSERMILPRRVNK
jgi:hypothetical protein